MQFNPLKTPKAAIIFVGAILLDYLIINIMPEIISILNALNWISTNMSPTIWYGTVFFMMIVTFGIPLLVVIEE